MRILDLHADIGWNINRLVKEKEEDILNKYHLKDLRKGEVLDSSAACFFVGFQNWKDMQEMINNTVNEINKNNLKIIKTAKDFNPKRKEISFIITVEGMCGIKNDVRNKIKWMYDKGVRIASLCWNDQNALATGLGGNVNRGLTNKGKEVIKEMNKLNMIIDISHTNEHTFWNILETSKKPIIATHSNARSLCNHRRNLTDEQIKAIVNKGGIIGLNAWDAVISNNPKEKNALGLAKHARYIADLTSHKNIACGFDFMNYYPEPKEKTNIDSAFKAQNFIKALKQVGFNDEEIKDIAYRNAYRFLKNNL